MHATGSRARAASLLTGLAVLIAACTPAGTAAPTGQTAPTGGISSPAATSGSSASAAASPAATTSTPTTAPASPSAAAPTTVAGSPGASPAAGQVAYATFAAQTGSSTSVTGAATLIEANGSTVVVIGVVQTGSDPIAAAIQEGTCPSPNPLIKFELTPLVAGASVTTVQVSLADVLATDHVINLFVAGSETESSISCGDIQELAASTP